MLRIPLAILLLLLIAVSGCEKCAPSKKAPEEAKPVIIKTEEINLKETRLASIAEGAEATAVVFSSDGSQVAYAARNREGRQFIAVGDRPGELYDEVYQVTLVLSRDGKRVAYSGKRKGKWHFVLDGVERKQPFEDTGSTFFTPDGRLFGIELKDGGEWSLSVLEGEKEVFRSRAYPEAFRPPAFSPDGRLLVFEFGDAKHGSLGNGRTFFFLDLPAMKIVKEKPCVGCGKTGTISFSADSLKAAYNVQKEGKKFLFLLNFASDEERTIELPAAGQFVLSPDGTSIAYVATKEGRQFTVETPWESPAKGKEYGPYDAVVLPVFSPDSAKFACQTMKEGKWRIAVGDKEGPAYDAVGDFVSKSQPVFSPDGSRVAYPANRGGHQDRGRTVGGKWFMVVSPAGNPAKAAEGPAYDMALTPVFSPDGKYVAYRARTGTMEKAKRFIVIADAQTGNVIKEGLANDEVWPPVWSIDGKAAGYGVRSGRELWWRVESVE